MTNPRRLSNLREPAFPPPDPAKYPNPLDEPFEELCRRTGMRPPEPGEDSISWAMNQSQLPKKPEE